MKIKKTKIQKDKIIPEPKPEKRKDNKVERVETKKSINEESSSIEKKIRGKSHAKVVEYAEKAHADDLTLPIGMFVFSMASNEMNTELCRKHKNIYLKQLKKYKTWALMSKYTPITLSIYRFD